MKKAIYQTEFTVWDYEEIVEQAENGLLGELKNRFSSAVIETGEYPPVVLKYRHSGETVRIYPEQVLLKSGLFAGRKSKEKKFRTVSRKFFEDCCVELPAKVDEVAIQTIYESVSYSDLKRLYENGVYFFVLNGVACEVDAIRTGVGKTYQAYSKEQNGVKYNLKSSDIHRITTENGRLKFVEAES